MPCIRCQGLMIADRFVDLAESGSAEFSGWRCLVCGNIVDTVIATNRRRRAVQGQEKRLPNRPLAA